LKSTLELHSESNQKNVRSYLSGASVDFQILWLTNQIYIKGVSSDTVNNLAPFEEVVSIEEDIKIPFENPVSESNPTTKQDNYHVRGVRWIEADKAQEVLRSINTTQIVVGIVDTGVKGTHEALSNSYVGAFGWYDAAWYSMSRSPEDADGPGTHVTGTILGENGVGVFPAAKWMACRACFNSSCSYFDIITCSQFMICPYLINGTIDCSKAPHVVSQFFIYNRIFPERFAAIIRAYHAIGIIPVLAGGDMGPSCGTVEIPEDHRYVIAVGATTYNESIANFSSVGPAVGAGNGDDVKPDLVAPGMRILSADIEGDDNYIHLSGTRMASSFVTGVVAMMLAVNPNLTFDQVRHYLLQGVDKDQLVSSGQSCGGIPDTEFPNHVFGYGRLNALKSVNLVISDKDKGEEDGSTLQPPVVIIEEKKSSINTVVLAVVCSIAGIVVIGGLAGVFVMRKKFLKTSAK